jgi:hypothetical protein
MAKQLTVAADLLTNLWSGCIRPRWYSLLSPRAKTAKATQ